MAHDTSLATFMRQYRQRHLSQQWQEFRKFRGPGYWPDVEHRHQHEDLKILLEQYGIDADVQSPLLEKEHADEVAIMRSNAAHVDMLSLDSGDKAKERVEELRIYVASRLLQEEEDGDLSQSAYEALVFPYGIWYAFKTWHMPEEPDAPEKEEDENEDAFDKRSNKARHDYYAKADSPFAWEIPNPLEMSHWPLRNPTLFFQDSIISYVEARDLKQYRMEDKPFRVLKQDKRLMFGETEPGGEVDWNGAESDELKLRRIRRAMYNKETRTWHVTEYICEGNPAETEISERNGVILDDYECPYGHAPFFYVASGSSRRNETNPHLAYRPKLYGLMVKIQELNTIDSLLIKRILWRLKHPYHFSLRGVDPLNVDKWVEGMKAAGFNVDEGVGAQQDYFVSLAQTAADEIAVAPSIEAIPDNDIQGLLARRDQVKEEIQEYRANRFLVGSADIDGPPASSILDQHQAARTPVGPYLKAFANFLKEWYEAELDAYAFWDEDSPASNQKPVIVKVRGDEPTGELSKPRDAGDVVEFTAVDITAQDYIISIQISDETDSERQMQEQSADDAYHNQRALTQEQWLKRRGFEDPKKQGKLLEERRREEMMQPVFDQQHQADIMTLYSMLTGINPASLAPPPPDPSMAGGATGGAQTQASRGYGVHNGTAPVVESASGSTNALAGSF